MPASSVRPVRWLAVILPSVLHCTISSSPGLNAMRSARAWARAWARSFSFSAAFSVIFFQHPDVLVVGVAEVGDDVVDGVLLAAQAAVFGKHPLHVGEPFPVGLGDGDGGGRAGRGVAH